MSRNHLVRVAGLGVVLASLLGCSQDPARSSSDGAPAPDLPPLDLESPAPDLAPTDAVPPAVAPYADCQPTDPEAKFLQQTALSGTLNAGDVVPVSVTFANCAAAPWSAVGPQADKGIKLGSQGPQDNEHWGVGRVALPTDVPVGHSVRFDFSITAPQYSGSYGFQWAMVDEGVRWLEQKSPLQTVEVKGNSKLYDFHPRSEWETSSQPVSSGSTMDLLALRYITLHYNGGNLDLDGADNVYQDSDYAQLLRQMQNDYVVNRGYSLGYNSGIAPDGDEWQIRGLTYRCAANGCVAVNKPAYAIQITLPSITAQPTADQIQGTRQAIARVRAAAKAAGNTHQLYINGHRDVRPECGTGGTACPGDAIYALIQQGTFEP